ncbi:hypothetical protein [Nonomuraea sp. NPDC023979]|uniref:hypothetical protein n=1 Tax=Nonomuraea sp. NPDC023979 TaxID=3154796 RepID=UPI00340778B5
MSQSHPGRDDAAPTSKELSLARRQRNIERELAKTAARRARREARRELQAGRPAVAGQCQEVRRGPAPAAPPAAYRGESAPARAYWAVRDNWDDCAPWVCSASLFTAGAAAYLADPVNAKHVAAVSLLGAATWATVKLRHVVDKTWAAAGVVSSGVWLTIAEMVGPMNLWTAGSLAAGSLVGAWRWQEALRRRRAVAAVENPPAAEMVYEETPQPSPMPAPAPAPEPDAATLALKHWSEEWARVADQLSACKGSRLTELTELGPDHRILRVQLVPITQLATSVAGCARNIETGLLTQDGAHLRPGAVQILPDEDDSTVVYVHIRQGNPLAEAISFDMVRPHLPRSITQPLILGMREDKEWDTQLLLYYHWVFGADTGGGKSNFIHTVLANLHLCADALIWGADMKGGRALGPWLPRIDWLATSLEEIDLQLRSLEQIIDYRSANIDLDSDKLAPSEKCPAIVYIIDEGAEVTGARNKAGRGAEFAKRLESINSLGRAVAVQVIFATQYCSLEAFTSPTFRQQFRVQFLLSTTSKLAASFLLGDDAWSKLDVSMLSKPGMYYKRNVGMTAPLPARTPHMAPGDSNDLVASLAREGAKVAPSLDAGSASVCVAEYASRRTRIPAKLMRKWLSDPAPQGIPVGGSFEQPALPAAEGFTWVPQQVSPAALQGSPAGVPGAGWQGGPGGVPEVGGGGYPWGAPAGSPAGPGVATAAGLPAGSPMGPGGDTAETARERLDRIWASGPGGDVTAEAVAAARMSGQSLNLDAANADAEGLMVDAILGAGPNGITRKQLEDATGRRKTWLSPRANALCAAELCYRPRDIDGLYAPTQGVTREEMLSALRRFSDQIRDTRRAGREAADRAS